VGTGLMGNHHFITSKMTSQLYLTSQDLSLMQQI